MDLRAFPLEVERLQHALRNVSPSSILIMDHDLPGFGRYSPLHEHHFRATHADPRFVFAEHADVNYKCRDVHHRRDIHHTIVREEGLDFRALEMVAYFTDLEAPAETHPGVFACYRPVDLDDLIREERVQLSEKDWGEF